MIADNRTPDERKPQQRTEERFYVEVVRSDWTYIEVVARSKEEAQQLVDEMTPEEVMENADDWDWDGDPPCPTGVAITEAELIAQGRDAVDV